MKLRPPLKCAQATGELQADATGQNRGTTKKVQFQRFFKAQQRSADRQRFMYLIEAF